MNMIIGRREKISWWPSIKQRRKGNICWIVVYCQQGLHASRIKSVHLFTAMQMSFSWMNRKLAATCIFRATALAFFMGYCHHWCRHDWCRYHWCRTVDVNFLMPVTIDARHDWCPWSFFDASHFWCPSLFMPRKLFWCQSQSRLMSVTIDARHHWCPSLLMPVPSNAGLNHNPEFY